MGLVTIPAQYGGRHAHKKITNNSRNLRKLFDRYLAGNYFRTIRELCIILRVSGEMQDFKGEGPELFEYIEKDKCLKIDFAIPETRWKKVPVEEIKIYFIRGIIACTRILIEEAGKLNELTNENQFWCDFYQAVCCFLSLNEPLQESTLETYDPATVKNTLEKYDLPNYCE